jgi:hypothetical protein
MRSKLTANGAQALAIEMHDAMVANELSPNTDDNSQAGVALISA